MLGKKKINSFVHLKQNQRKERKVHYCARFKNRFHNFVIFCGKKKCLSFLNKTGEDQFLRTGMVVVFEGLWKTQKCWFPNLRILVKIIVAYFYPFWIKMKWKTAKTAKTKIFKSKCSGNHPFSCQNLQQLKSRGKIEEALHMRHNRVTKNC